jgi:hypothetical protein
LTGLLLKGDIIPDTNHVSRYCKSSSINKGKPEASAFILRESENELSVNWLECLNCENRDFEIVKMREIYNQYISLGAKAKIVALNVGKIRTNVKSSKLLNNRDISVTHDPYTVNGIVDETHSLVHNMRPENELIAELIVETISENDVYSAR